MKRLKLFGTDVDVTLKQDESGAYLDFDGAKLYHNGFGTGGGLIYKAILAQSGTSNPTVTALSPSNTIEGIVWTRGSIGQFNGTLEGAFPIGRTFMHIDTGGSFNYTSCSFPSRDEFFDPSPNGVNFSTYDADSNLVDIGGQVFVYIEVWPSA